MIKVAVYSVVISTLKIQYIFYAFKYVYDPSMSLTVKVGFSVTFMTAF